MFRRFLPLALLALPLAVACSVDSAASTLPASNSKSVEPGDLGVPETPTLPPSPDTSDAAASFFGSPLCGVSAKTCTPDDDGTTPTSLACANLADAGTTQSKGTGGAFACRVAAKGPVCPKYDESANLLAEPWTPNADVKGVDGVTCQTDGDCAPGFDCVAPSKGEKSNVCRRYCCSASCNGVSAHNGGPTFCDVRQVVRSEAAPSDQPLIAPVCMPIKTCTLLKDGDCADSETCAIVNDKGATGCVPTDGDDRSAGDGESCEKKHCKAGLTCLGTPGDRTCYTLCRTTGDKGPQCKAGSICMTSSAFLDTTYGVCKPAQ